MSEMVERVVLALVATPQFRETTLTPDLVFRMARAAIAAMREPTEAMAEAADAEDRKQGEYCADGSSHWRAMIDEALK